MNGTDADGLRVVLDDAVLRLTFTNPDNRNAQTPAFWQRLADAMAYGIEQQVRAVVVDAEGPSFSAGIDRRMFTPEGVPGQMSFVDLVGSDEGLDEGIAMAQSGFAALADGPAIVIGLVQGHAVGAGFQLALACDLVVCADDATFSMKEAMYGLIPDLTGTSPLVRTVGYPRALEICLSTRAVPAVEAVALGIAVDSVPREELAAAGEGYVKLIRDGIPGTAEALKSVLRHAITAEPADQRIFERATQAGRLRWLVSAMSGS